MGIDNLGKEMTEAASEIRKAQKNQTKEITKNINLYKEYRKTLTGVLIDLHWLRILGAQSKVLAANTEMLGKAFGYLIDMILLPMFPVMVKFTKMVLGLAQWIGHLDRPTRLLIAGLGSLAIGVTVLMTVIYTAVSAINAFTAAITRATVAKTTQTTLSQYGAGAAAGGGLTGTLSSVILSGAVGYLAMRNVIKPIQNRKKIEGEISNITRSEGFLPPLELFLPKFAEGGVTTKPTAGIFGEGGAEAIIPLSKIGEVMGSILGSGAGFVNTLTQAAMGGGGVGGGLNMPGTGGGGGTLVKGFSWVAMSINQGFKITNELLAAILALLAQGTGGAGGGGFDPIKLAEDAWSAITLAAKTAWDIITAKATEVWNVVLTTAKWVWDSVYSLAKYAWDGIVTFAGNVWDTILTTATTAWATITDVARNAWDNILTTAQTVWTSIGDTSKQVWDSIFVIADDVWERIHDKHITLINAVLALLPKSSGGGTTGGGATTGGGTTGGGATTGGGTTSGGTPLFEGLQKVFEGGVYIGDWELYSDGTKKWRPNPNIAELSGTTAPPSGAGTTSPLTESGGGFDITAYITQGADDYAYTVNTAMQTAAQTTSTAIEDTSTSFIDVFVDGITAVGSVIWNTFSDAAETVYSTVTGAVGNVVSAASDAITTANDWLSNTFGGLGQSMGLPAPPPPAPIPIFQSGGVMPSTGLAYLHEGETVIPKTGGGVNGVTINNPTFVVSGRTERELFENFMKLMKTEGVRMR